MLESGKLKFRTVLKKIFLEILKKKIETMYLKKAKSPRLK